MPQERTPAEVQPGAKTEEPHQFVRRAIEKMEAIILEDHLHTCVIDGIKNGREEQVVQELQELYTLANR